MAGSGNGGRSPKVAGNGSRPARVASVGNGGRSGQSVETSNCDGPKEVAEANNGGSKGTANVEGVCNDGIPGKAAGADIGDRSR